VYTALCGDALPYLRECRRAVRVRVANREQRGCRACVGSNRVEPAPAPRTGCV